ncbi:MAG: RDD family protein [Chitinophagales bacterium]|nr:RDD family protein [Chitinophagales bacterium]
MTHNYKSASLMTRIIAFIIDGILLGAVICALLFVQMGGKDIPVNADEGKISIADKYEFFSYAEAIVFDSNRSVYIRRFALNYPLSVLIIILIPVFYWTIFEKTSGATIGKFVTGIRVRRKDTGNISWSTALIRAVGKIISTLIFFLGYLIAFFDRKRQTLHDKIANTIVIKK